MEKVINLYKKEFPKKKVKFINNQFTKTFIKWNQNKVKKGLLDIYLGTDKIFDSNSKTFKKTTSILDSRFLLPKLKKKYSNYILKNNILTKVNKNSFRFVTGEKAPRDFNNTDIELTNNKLLLLLIKELGISGKYRILITHNNEKLIDRAYILDKSFWKKNEKDFWKNSDYMLWNDEKIKKGDEVVFTFSKEFEVTYDNITQAFLDGVNHCFFEPIRQSFLNVLENTKSKVTKEKYQSKLNIIDGKIMKTKTTEGLIHKYKTGIPADKIGDVCEKLQISVTIDQPFNKTPLLEYKCNKKALKHFKYINTRLDHIDINTNPCSVDSIFKNFEPIIVSKCELINIEQKLIDSKELCITTKNVYGISSIRTLDNFYKLDNDFGETVKEFEKETKLNECAIDANSNKQLQNYINNGIHFNGTVDFKDTEDFIENIPKSINHIDMTKAYTQFKHSKYYSGFMGKITDFRKCDNYKQKGLYHIINLDLTNCNEKFKKLNKDLGWFYTDNIYTDAELVALKEHGAKFNVTSGAFGLKMDFEFSEEMINKKVKIQLNDREIEIPYYCKWSGMITNTDSTNSFYMEGTKEYFEQLKSEDYDIYYADNSARINYQKKYIYNKTHITAQITAYQRLIMLEQLLKMDNSKLVRVCVDGIYFEDHQFDILGSFSFKEKKTFRNKPANDYLSNLSSKAVPNAILEPSAEPRDFYKTELWKGAGGNGKTYSNIFKDKGLVNVVYIAHSWKLATYMKKEYEESGNGQLNVSVHSRLLNEPYQTELSKRFNNYIIDECSMINENEKQTIFKNVTGKVILCGDVGFQLSPFIGEQMNENNIDNVIELKKNYRFKDDKIKTIIKKVRKNINGTIDYLGMGLKTISLDSLKNIYTHKKDIILRFQNELKEGYKGFSYTETFKTLEKYKVSENTRDYKNGEIVYQNINTKKELRHGFTVHSIQGETYNGNIYIDLKNMNNQLFYTAISRTQYYEQIFIIV